MASRKWRGRGGIGETENGGAGERAYSPLNTRKYAKGRRRYCNGLVVIGGGAKCMWILTQRREDAKERFTLGNRVRSTRSTSEWSFGGGRGAPPHRFLRFGDYRPTKFTTRIAT